MKTQLTCLYEAARTYRTEAADLRKKKSQFFVAKGSTMQLAKDSTVAMEGVGCKAVVEGNI